MLRPSATITQAAVNSSIVFRFSHDANGTTAAITGNATTSAPVRKSTTLDTA